MKRFLALIMVLVMCFGIAAAETVEVTDKLDAALSGGTVLF